MAGAAKGTGWISFPAAAWGRPYRLDFYCAKARLCVEVDGEAHARGDRPERDAVRDHWLELHGVATLRIRAAEVLGNLEGVVRHILERAVARG